MPRNAGGALAVDLRRARAARRRAERACEAAAPGGTRDAPRSPTYRVSCRNRDPFECVREWFELHGWTPFPFQEEVWRAYLAGESGLIHAATGTGKTYAAWMGPVLEWLRDYPVRPRRKAEAPPLRVLWITPLRALAGDTEAALRAPVEDLGLPWTVESRTGDTSARIRARQRERLPTALVTTPESLSLLLTRDDAATCSTTSSWWSWTNGTSCWRASAGVQTELALARLRRFRPALRTLGLSATLGNLDVARDALLGVGPDGAPRPGRIIRGLVPKALAGRRADSRDDRALPLVRADRPQAAARGRPRHRGGRDRARLHQHPRHGRDLVPGDAGGPAGLGGHHGAAPRLARPRHARVGGGRAPRRPACAASSAPPRSTSAWTSRRWTACCRSAAPRPSAA